MLRSRVRLPGARSSNLVVRALRALWTAPTNLLGHLAGLIVSGRRGRRVGGPAAVAWIYEIRSGLGLDWVGAVTLGHAILHRPDMFAGGIRGRLVLAHELAHTRQHDLLGPLYLPLHILAQATSAILSLGRPVVVSRVHDRNPLEQTFICLGAGATLFRNPRTGSEPPAMRSPEQSSSSRDANHTPLPPGFDAEDLLGRFRV